MFNHWDTVAVQIAELRMTMKNSDGSRPEQVLNLERALLEFDASKTLKSKTIQSIRKDNVSSKFRFSKLQRRLLKIRWLVAADVTTDISVEVGDRKSSTAALELKVS